LYGKWEDISTNTLPKLDACGGQYGVTPDSNGMHVYHYHIQDKAPFTLGCVGPNADGSLVTVEQCRAVNADACKADDKILLFTARQADGSSITVPYQPDCPCWDESGLGLNGAGLNVGNVLPSRTWYTRKLNADGTTWSDDQTGTFATHSNANLQNGATIVERAAISDTGPGGVANSTGASTGIGPAPTPVPGPANNDASNGAALALSVPSVVILILALAATSTAHTTV
jgi:hypothetical protein